MKITIEDLKTNTTVDIYRKSIDCINIGHKMIVNYVDEDAKLKTIEGVVCSITHTIAEDWIKTTYIKIY